MGVAGGSGGPSRGPSDGPASRALYAPVRTIARKGSTCETLEGMRGKLLVAMASALGTASVVFGVLACQTISGLTDIEKVDCLDCGDTGAGDAGPPCTHTFCAGFDQGTLLAGWRAQSQSPGGMLSLDTAQSKSPPASLLATVPKTDTGSAVASLAQSFGLPLKGAHLELDLRLSQLGSFPVPEGGISDAGSDADADAGDLDASADDSGDASAAEAGVDAGPPAVVLSDFVRVASISAPDAATATGIALAWRNGGAFVLVVTPLAGGAVSELALPLTPTPALDRFVHVKIDVVFSATGGGSVKVTIDGAPALDRSGLSIAGSGAAGAQLDVGLATRDTTPELKASYDNVTLDLDP